MIKCFFAKGTSIGPACSVQRLLSRAMFVGVSGLKRPAGRSTTNLFTWTVEYGTLTEHDMLGIWVLDVLDPVFLAHLG